MTAPELRMFFHVISSSNNHMIISCDSTVSSTATPCMVKFPLGCYSCQSSPSCKSILHSDLVSNSESLLLDVSISLRTRKVLIRMWWMGGFRPHRRFFPLQATQQQPNVWIDLTSSFEQQHYSCFEKRVRIYGRWFQLKMECVSLIDSKRLCRWYSTDEVGLWLCRSFECNYITGQRPTVASNIG